MKEAWDALKADFEKQSHMITIELRKRLHDIRCTENGNICSHFDTIRTRRKELASLGTTLDEQDFSAIILGSLPKNYDQFLSAVTTTASSKEKSSDAASCVGGTSNKGGKRSTKDVECFNCHKKGHNKSDCWVKWDGKEGQGPMSKNRKGKGEDSKNGNKEVE